MAQDKNVVYLAPFL